VLEELHRSGRHCAARVLDHELRHSGSDRVLDHERTGARVDRAIR
jgi:hypothetical protein